MHPAAKRIGTALAWLWPYLVLTSVGTWLLWPMPLGVMPLSADHTVHLTRAYLVGQNLSQGYLTGWDSTWFFGFPAGELYPVLGDLGVNLLRGLSLGLAEWSACYAWLVWFVFVLQGWVLVRAGRLFGLGAVPGLLAGLWMLLDAGSYREGGFVYTITYGVWPQALSTSLAFWAFAELARGLRWLDPKGDVPSDSPGRPRALLRAGVGLGAALLAHPMALLMSAVGAVLMVATHGVARPGRQLLRLRRTLLDTGLVLALGVGLSAFWLLPMLANRGWMVSYGWLYMPLRPMVDMLLDHGAWTHAMPKLLGYTMIVGVVVAAIRGTAFVRFVALWGVCHWLLASTDVFWRLRLDLVSEGFTHLQYQRFLIAAKPALYLLAGWVLALPIAWARRVYGQQSKRWLAVLAGVVGLSSSVYLTDHAYRIGTQHGLGQLQLVRLPGKPELDRDYAQLVGWLKEQVLRHPGEPLRIAVKSHRNLHWFMDAPVFTGARVYKLGFTPGSNFVHKPEVGHPQLYDRLGVRHVVTTGRVPNGAELVARFGQIKVWARELVGPRGAHLEGPGNLRVIDGEPDDGDLKFEVGEAGNQPHQVTPGTADETWLVVHVAGYPRWQMSQDGVDIPWIEVPARLPRRGQPLQTASQQQRRSGALRGGKAHGDDGSEPILMAAKVGPGVVELHYRRWMLSDVLGAGLTLLCLGLVGLRLRPARLERAYQVAYTQGLRLLHPYILAALAFAVVAGATSRWVGGYQHEATLASSQLQSSTGVVAAPLKTDMLIVPALVVERGVSRLGKPVAASFRLARVPEQFFGWVSLEDDDAKMRAGGHVRVRVELCRESTCSDEQWDVLSERRLRHKPGRIWFKLDSGGAQKTPGQLRVTVVPSGKSPPRVGLNIDLSGQPWHPGVGL